MNLATQSGLHRIAAFGLGVGLALVLPGLAVAQSSQGAAARVPSSVWEIACSDTTALAKPFALDAAAIAGATEIMIISLEDCEEEDIPSAEALESLRAVLAPTGVLERVKAEAGRRAEIIAATLDDGRLRVYLHAHHD